MGLRVSVDDKWPLKWSVKHFYCHGDPGQYTDYRKKVLRIASSSSSLHDLTTDISTQTMSLADVFVIQNSNWNQHHCCATYTETVSSPWFVKIHHHLHQLPVTTTSGVFTISQSLFPPITSPFKVCPLNLARGSGGGHFKLNQIWCILRDNIWWQKFSQYYRQIFESFKS